MTQSTKISLRLDARLHAQAAELVAQHPNASLSKILNDAIADSLSDCSTFKARVLLEAAVANLAAILSELQDIEQADLARMERVRHHYGKLLELLIDIDGVEQ